MKYTTVVLAIFVSLQITAGHAQNATTSGWRPLLTAGLTGADFKLPRLAARSRLLIGLSGSQTIGQYSSGSLFSEQTFLQLEQSVFGQPERFEQLFEQLGGEFWFGTPSQPVVFTGINSTAERALGLEIIVPIGRHLAVQAGAAKGGFTTTAAYPLTVFDTNHHQTRQEPGRVEAAMHRWQFNISGRYYLLSRSAVQPFAGVGVQYSKLRGDNYTFGISDISWSFGQPPSETAWQAILQAGLSVQPRTWPVFAELSGAFQSGGRWQIGGVVGWKF